MNKIAVWSSLSSDLICMQYSPYYSLQILQIESPCASIASDDFQSELRCSYRETKAKSRVKMDCHDFSFRLIGCWSPPKYSSKECFKESPLSPISSAVLLTVIQCCNEVICIKSGVWSSKFNLMSDLKFWSASIQTAFPKDLQLNWLPLLIENDGFGLH